MDCSTGGRGERFSKEFVLRDGFSKGFVLRGEDLTRDLFYGRGGGDLVKGLFYGRDLVRDLFYGGGI